MFLTEHVIVGDVNNTFTVTNAGATDFIINIPTGQYRDIITLTDEIGNTITNADPSQTWLISFNTSNNNLEWASNASFSLDFDTSNNGTSLRDKLGFTVDTCSSIGNQLTSNTKPEGCLIPNEPVENDNRPYDISSDRFDMDIFTSETRGGVIANKGGSSYIYNRSVTFLLLNTELNDYIDWLKYSKNRDIAFYHDLTETWPGANSEYNTYKLLFNNDSGYDPEQLEDSKVWFRINLDMRQSG